MKNSPLKSKLLEVRELLTKGVLCDFLPTVLLFRNEVWNPSESGFSEIVYPPTQVEISSQNWRRAIQWIGTFFFGSLISKLLEGREPPQRGWWGLNFHTSQDTIIWRIPPLSPNYLRCESSSQRGALCDFLPAVLLFRNESILTIQDFPRYMRM